MYAKPLFKPHSRSSTVSSLKPPAFPEVKGLYAAIGPLTLWVQSAAGLEVVHSIIRVVRAPFLTTFLQGE